MQVDILVLMAVADVDAVKDDMSGGRLFQQVQAPQERRFAAAGGSDDGDDLVFVERRADILQNLQLVEALAEVLHLDHSLLIFHATASFLQAIPDGC